MLIEFSRSIMNCVILSNENGADPFPSFILDDPSSEIKKIKIGVIKCKGTTSTPPSRYPLPNPFTPTQLGHFCDGKIKHHEFVEGQVQRIAMGFYSGMC